MNYQDIERIAELEEGSNLEFKESTGQLDRSMETLCAFLNGDGGNILYGVKDNGKIIGQRSPTVPNVPLQRQSIELSLSWSWR